MKLFYQDLKPDFQKIKEDASKGYGIPHPEMIQGFSGAFMFTLHDVYLSSWLEHLLMLKPDFSDTLQNLLIQFKKEEYGVITEDEWSNNGEQRHLCGSHCYMIARYDTEVGRIIFESFFDMALLYLDGEDISAIKALQESKRQNYINR